MNKKQILKQLLKIKNKMKPRLQEEQQEGNYEGSFLLYGDITLEVANEIVQAIKTGIKELRINSYGGDFFAGASIAEAVRENDVWVVIDGVAASAAALPVIAAKRNASVPSGYLYIHRTWVTVTGNCHQLRLQADQLERFDKEVLIRFLMERTGKTEEEVVQWLDAQVEIEDGSMSIDGSLFSAEEAKQLGLIDEILGTETEQNENEGQGEGEQVEVVEKKKRILVTRNFIPSDPPGGEGVGVEGDWEKPNLQDFTDKGWEELDIEEKRFIASHYAWAFDLETFDSLKLPHHYPPSHSQHPKASLNGVRNALARLPLVDGLTEDERESIREHLLSHLPVEEKVVWSELLTLFLK